MSQCPRVCNRLDFATVAVCLAILASPFSTAPPAAAQSAAEVTCVKRINRAAAQLSSAVGRNNTRCVADAIKGALANADACIDDDPKGRIGKATGKIDFVDTQRCSGIGVSPPFGFTGASTAKQTPQDKGRALVRELFGTGVQSSMGPSGSVTAKCQTALVRAAERLAEKTARDFVNCKKDGFKKHTIVSRAGLEACVGANRKSKLDRARQRIDRILDAKCPVDFDAAFPGDCTGPRSAFAACVKAKAIGRTCETINAVDGIDVGCDLLDDGVVNGSSIQCNNGIVEAGEDCDDGNNADDGNGCDVDCRRNDVCGDGVVQSLFEACDDGNLLDGDGCSSRCALQQDPQCPDHTLRSFYSGISQIACSSNADCSSAGHPGVCDDVLGVCATASEIDSGWTGSAHDLDPNGGYSLAVNLLCPGGSLGGGPVCGVCSITGIDPAAGNCRCSNDNRSTCDAPFDLDGDDCGTGVACTSAADCRYCSGDASVKCTSDGDCASAGGACVGGGSSLTCNAASGLCEGTCRCYLGPPLPMSVDDNPACVLSRFDVDLSGTVDVDGGDQAVLFETSDFVHVGGPARQPCPVCNSDPTPNDGLRGGICAGGESDGKACDVHAVNPSFPALPGANGGGHSYDCFPSPSLVVAILDSARIETTGSQSLTRDVDCGLFVSLPGFPKNCFCRVCSGDWTIPCNTDADCSDLGAGTCSSNGVGGRSGVNDCDPSPANGGDGVSTGACADGGDGEEGLCASAADDQTFCDGVLLADGRGFLSCNPTPRCEGTFAFCTSDADCAAGLSCTTDTDCSAGTLGFNAGACTLTQRRPCFLDPLSVTGTADAGAPLAVSLACVAPSISSAVNSVTGFPGPQRIRSQQTQVLRCGGPAGTVYSPGLGGCP